MFWFFLNKLPQIYENFILELLTSCMSLACEKNVEGGLEPSRNGRPAAIDGECQVCDVAWVQSSKHIEMLEPPESKSIKLVIYIVSYIVSHTCTL